MGARWEEMKVIQQYQDALSRYQYRVVEPGARAHAAVSIILEEQPAGVKVLFIERATNKNDPWSGQIGFPGGRVESGDACAKDAAEREAREELGIELAESRYLGRVSDVAPGGLDIVISGFVYAVDGPLHVKPDCHEVAGVFWLPLVEINNPLHRCYVDFTWRERVRRYPALDFFEENEKPIWGITYRMLRNFGKAITPALKQ